MSCIFITAFKVGCFQFTVCGSVEIFKCYNMMCDLKGTSFDDICSVVMLEDANSKFRNTYRKKLI